MCRGKLKIEGMLHNQVGAVTAEEAGKLEAELDRLKQTNKRENFFVRKFHKIFARIKNHFVQMGWPGFIVTLKATLAFFITAIMAVLQAPTDKFGYIWFLIIALPILWDHSATIGASIESWFWIQVCMGAAIGYSCFALWLSATWPFGLLLFLIPGVYFFGYWKSKFIPAAFACTIAVLIIGIEMVSGVREGSFDAAMKHTQRTLLVVFSGGTTISLLVDLIVFPRIATKILEEELINMLRNISLLQQFAAKNFLAKATPEESVNAAFLSGSIRASFQKIVALGRASSREIILERFLLREREKLLSYARTLGQKTLTLAYCSNFIEKTNADPQIIQILDTLEKPIAKTLEGVRKATENLALILHGKNPDPELFSPDFHELETSFTTAYTEALNVSSDPWEKVFHIYFFFFSLQSCLRHAQELDQYMHNLGVRPRRHLRVPLLADFIEGMHSRNAHSVAVAVQKNKKKRANSNFRFWIWSFFDTHIFNEHSKYAVKYALAMSVAILPAIVGSINEWFLEWRGDWVAVTVSVIMLVAWGEGLWLAIHRIIGTIIGAGLAILVWLPVHHNPYYVVAISTFIAFIIFHLRFNTIKYARVSVIALLAYNIVTFNKYERPELYEVWVIAGYRTLMTIWGILITLVVSRLFWPLVARKELRRTLSKLLLDLSLLYQKTAASFMRGQSVDSSFQEISTHIQIELGKASALFSIARLEPRIKGTFQAESYQRLITHCQSILSLLGSVKDLFASGADLESLHEFMAPLQRLRHQAFDRIMQTFYILSGALKTKEPLPHQLPDVSSVRTTIIRRLTDNLFELQNSHVQRGQMFYYGYSFAIRKIMEELESIGLILKGFFGQSDDFPSLDDEEHNEKKNNHDFTQAKALIDASAPAYTGERPAEASA